MIRRTLQAAVIVAEIVAVAYVLGVDLVELFRGPIGSNDGSEAASDR